MTLSLELWLPPLVAGLSLLLIGGIWQAAVRARRRRRSQSLLHVALSNPDPRVRLAAVQVAVQQGISPVAGVLLQATRNEQDPAVLEGITEAVARHQWEPSLEPELLELRLWAQRRLVELRHDQRERPAQTNGVPHEPAHPASLPRVIDWLLDGGRADQPRWRGGS
jgi:hypothetical protein